MTSPHHLINVLLPHQLECIVLMSQTSEHADRLYCGLRTLADRGSIRLTVEESEAPEWVCVAPRLSRNRSIVRLIVDGKRVLYDLDDSSSLSADGEKWADLSFKRMLASGQETAIRHAYGLNYPVTERVVQSVEEWRDVPSVTQLQPGVTAGSGILCMTRLWDPDDAHSPHDVLWRERINTFRIELISRLRAEFAEGFTGGIADDPYSRARCAPDLLAEERITQKDAYLTAASLAEIVVTTAGLHDSIGWRFGEAVSLGRPVVSESFDCTLPGVKGDALFRAFDDVDGAVNQIRDLRTNSAALGSMRARSRTYYREWLRPDVLVARTLSVASQR